MTAQTATVTDQGVFQCSDCSTVLRGADAHFNYCNDCQANHLVEPTAALFTCKKFPGCGCQVPDECTEEGAIEFTSRL